MLNKNSIVIGFILFGIDPSYAATLPPVYVFGEKDSKENLACGTLHTLAVSTAQSRLRYNQKTNANEGEYIQGRAIALYFNINSIETLPGMCAYSISAELYVGVRVRNPVDGRDSYENITYCGKSGIYHWRKVQISEQITAAANQYVDMCISEYEK